MTTELASGPIRPSVLIVDDNAAIRALIRVTLESSGYRVREAYDGIAAQRMVEQEEPDLVLLDLVLPRRAGLELLRQWRAEQRELGVLMLSGYGDGEQEIESLEAGADDFIKKPFSPRVLAARVGAVLRRRQSLTTWPDEITVGSARLLVAEGVMEFLGRRISLTRTETALLRELMRVPGKTVSPEELMTRVRGGPSGVVGDTGIIHTNVYRLRRKLESDPAQPRWLHGRHGAGYWFAPPSEPT